MQIGLLSMSKLFYNHFLKHERNLQQQIYDLKNIFSKKIIFIEIWPV
jgi:hypothetical protein